MKTHRPLFHRAAKKTPLIMRLLSIRIFLLLSLLASYLLLFSPQGAWDEAAPWLGEVESVKSYCDTGGANRFLLKLKEHQLEQWDAMFQKAGVDVSFTEGKFVTKSPYSLISTSGHEKHIQSMEAYPREEDYHELWMFFTLNPDKKHVLEVQHPELLATPIYDKMIEFFHLLGLLAGSALFLFSFYIPRASFGFWTGLAQTLPIGI